MKRSDLLRGIERMLEKRSVPWPLCSHKTYFLQYWQFRNWNASRLICGSVAETFSGCSWSENVLPAELGPLLLTGVSHSPCELWVNFSPACLVLHCKQVSRLFAHGCFQGKHNLLSCHFFFFLKYFNLNQTAIVRGISLAPCWPAAAFSAQSTICRFKYSKLKPEFPKILQQNDF